MKQTLNLLKTYFFEKKWALLILGIFVGLIVYGIINMVSSFNLEEIENILSQFPEGLIEFFGDPAEFTTPYGFLSLEFFSLIWIYVGVFFIYSSGSLLSQEVEEKTIELALSKPPTRVKFLGCKITAFYLYIFGLLGLVALINTGGVATSQIFIDHGLHLERLWGTYLIVGLFIGALSIVTIFFSTIFLNTKKAIVFGVVALFVFFFLGSFYSYMGDFESVKYVSVFFYYNPTAYLVHGNFDIFIRDLAVLGCVNIALILSSLIVFKKKDIPN